MLCSRSNPLLFSFSLSRYRAHRHLHSFPTRRSSDLTPATQCAACHGGASQQQREAGRCAYSRAIASNRDRKSTRLNSSHVAISYAVFCLKKKKIKIQEMYIKYVYTRKGDVPIPNR